MQNSLSGAAQKMLEVMQARKLAESDCAALLMVSGGSDSTALAYLAAELRACEALGPLAMLHVNHKLRGAEAEADAAFVDELAKLLDIPLFMCEIDIRRIAAQTGENVEALARHERYKAAHEALLSMCEHEEVPLEDGRIFTAHTADDRIENFYMRSIVGTGPGGFRSMLYKNGAVARPLLEFTRSELREYITKRAEGDLPSMPVLKDAFGNLWREDATNAQTDHFRAYVRSEIVPKAKKWNADAPTTLTRTMNLIADEDDMLREMALEIIEDAVRKSAEAQTFKLLPEFGSVRLPLARRALIILMKELLGEEERIDTSTIDAILSAFVDGVPKSGYVTNIQGNFAVSANKSGVVVEPMAAFRARRKKV